MKIQCDVCEKGDASVFCTADEAVLCNLCDHRVHHANKLASKHRRFSLLRPSAAEAPVCDVCRERRGFLFCQQDRAILCRECDDPIHSANELTKKHDRFLLTGVKLSTTAALYTPPPSGEKPIGSGGRGVSDPKSKRSVKNPPAVSPAPITCPPSVRVNAPQNIPPAAAVNKGGGGLIPTGGGGLASSISEYLMETLPGWHFEDFLDSSVPPPFVECGGVGLPFVEGEIDGCFSSSESLELWVPQGPPPALYGSGLMTMNNSNTNNGLKETKELGINSSKVVNRSVWTDDGFTVPQITSTATPSAGFKRSRPFW
ncbi:B-box zinc finger protein 21-like isoform X2 [Momordica charantia]|uniref:B-box zinc finger protein 21-like isoform X2 n=1 Tax=Momordica charantia TaxID=3673 RepID=A0A6J1CSK3_MOMCH|nr:B-box zinc finger protein 21-like isoform X2 [Momordica charantia]